MTFTAPDDLGLHTIRLTGDLDADTAPAALGRILTELDAARSRRVGIDLGEISLLAASGISMLIVAHQRACAAGVRLVVTELSVHARRTLAICGLIDEVTNSVDLASTVDLTD